MASNPLKRKLVCLLGIVSGLFLGLFALLAYDAHKTAQRDAEHKARVEAERLLASLDKEIAKVHEDVLHYANSDVAHSGVPARMTNYMNEMVKTSHSAHLVMMAVNLKGKVVAINTADKNGENINTAALSAKDVSEEEWFKQAASGEVEDGNVYFENPAKDELVGEIYNTPGMVMTFTAPIRNADKTKVLGIWTTKVDWNEIVKNAIGNPLPGKHEGFRSITLMDEEGLYLLHPQGEAYEFKKNDPAFEQKKAKFEDSTEHTFTKKEAISFSNRGRTVVEATSKSVGLGEFAGTGWITNVQVRTSNRSLKTLAAYALCGLVVSLAALLALLTMAKGVSSQAQVEVHTPGTVASYSQELNEASKLLAQAMNDQAPNLKKTAINFEELNLTVSKTLETANRFNEMVTKTTEFAQKEKGLIDEMVQLLEKINAQHTSILTQVEQSKLKMGSVTSLVNTLREKSQKNKDNVVQIRKDGTTGV